MSTNDDPARRGRRADQGESDWRTANRSANQYPGQNPRDNQQQQGTFSGYSRQSYPQQPYAPPRQEPPLPPAANPYDAPPLAQPGRGYEPPQQGYYQEPAPQQTYYQDTRTYIEPASPYSPQPTPYDAGQQAPYSGGGDLYGREPSAPQSFDPYNAGGAYRQDSFDERSYAPRQDAPRFYGQESSPPLPPQGALSGGYQQPAYSPQPPAYDPQPAVPPMQDNYQRAAFDPAFPPPAQGWEDDEPRSGRPPIAAHHDEFDEEFPDEDFDNEDYAPRKSRKKLFAALLLSAAAVVVGGGYGWKTLVGKGERATPLIQAERNPSREAPENPGGKQFPHGEKAIYDRLSPDGRTQVASFEPPVSVPAAFAGASAAASDANGSSLEQRIDEALKKAHGGGSDAPAGDQPTVVQSERYGPDGRKVENSRPVITPNIVNVDNGLPYPFGNAQPAGGQPMQQRPVAASASPQFTTATAVPVPPPGKQVKAAAHAAPPVAAPVPDVSTASAVPASAGAGGFYVSLKSAPDEKAIQKDLTALNEKYKTVLGEVQLTTKIADLGAKGVTYRAVAGPLSTKQEAADLCTKIKGVGGDKACFVTN